MILLKRLIQEFLCERMTFNQLLSASGNKQDNSRMDRAKHVNARSVRVTTIDENEAWTFSYKSQGHHSTTGDRHHGYVRFFKDNVRKNERASDIECMVDCDCPDYKYRWAYNNARAGASITGNSSWNGNNGKPPRPREQGGVGNLGEGLCKHLIALGKFLETEVSPEAPEQPQEPTQPEPKPSVATKPSITQPKKPTPSKPSIPTPQPEPTDQEDPDPTMLAAPQPSTPARTPEPDNTYTDTRAGGEDDEEDNDQSELTEGQVSSLYRKMEQFAKTHPQFDVPVYEDEKKPA